ncbi:hypothetical protein [Tenacibaculum aiptasiae]|uniref:hypothetical protein n=1 Tax=Tenacibaculum aiptasiae TaxID=426481 RepID=UPI003B59028D
MNVQNLCHFTYQLRNIVLTIKLQSITDKTLEHGKQLSKKELDKIYGLILIYESYIGISLFHDKFDKIKSIRREFINDTWKGLKVEKDLLNNQNRLNEDLLILNDNENSLNEIYAILTIVDRKTKEYFSLKNN